MDRTDDNESEETSASAARGAEAADASTVQRVTGGIQQGRAALLEMQGAITEKTRACVEATDSYVRDNPWQAVGIAAGAGFLLGLLLARR